MYSYFMFLSNNRKQGQRTISELTQTIIETETKYKAELSRYKKKYETEVHELEIQVDSLSRSNGELAKANKSLASRVKVWRLASDYRLLIIIIIIIIIIINF